MVLLTFVSSVNGHVPGNKLLSYSYRYVAVLFKSSKT